MKLIQTIGTRKNKNGNPVGYARFECPECGALVERMRCVGDNASNCGCDKYKRKKNINIKRTERICLMCSKPFKSEGAHNRRCPKCELRIYQAADATYYMPPVCRMRSEAPKNVLPEWH